jgi:hypothetical protein
MKKLVLLLLLGFIFAAGNLFAADGDLIVNGKIGIGVTAPYRNLHVNGAARFSNWGAGSYVEIMGTGDDYNYSALQLWSDETVSKIWLMMHKKASWMQNYFTLEEFDGTYWNDRFVIQPGGKIGIGTISPVATLDVNGGVRLGTVTSSCTTGIEGTVRYNSTSHAMEFCNGTTWKVFTTQ